MINTTYLEVQAWASSFLDENNHEAEIAYHLMLDMADFSVSDWQIHRQDTMPSELKDAYVEAIHKVVTENYPWQYIVGKAWFYGEDFKVTPATLIPRQETEDLVTFVFKLIKNGQIKPDAKILDIGTGTGIIAITLKTHYPNLQITATDISPEALAVAKENAQAKNTTIRFELGDLYDPVANEKFDVIISNPPYISEDETDVMSLSTLLYEPKGALFADDSGYDIYWRLFEGLNDHLTSDAHFIAEFGYKQGRHLLTRAKAMFPNLKANIIQDYTGNDRILWINS
ncbi:peptide chain release factor N(5)-glutamine methyltransferase [Aerococcus sp. 1KP-2016]|uniref:peptide chain release factor N(5)-glutamine methyltransferase n=1 Tax=Aerococcus sp. 1KP-2016 TaxID=1981982 RepID=UPI000B993612|nr:peptide chain release factor N(5)-glutamine methyltransferase [Aerococcus sp. 1KP-2016]OYQ67599.1 protein-(glutamine-N5) methyltransferase, release factor-specific [Aerococcus sp. 1KP-2016]